MSITFLLLFLFVILSYILAASALIAANSFASITSLSTLDISVGGFIQESIIDASSILVTSSSIN